MALWIVTEHIVALWYKLRSIGADVDGATYVFCDNDSMVLSSTIPGSMLKKKQNVI